jgi:hypothetical protein
VRNVTDDTGILTFILLNGRYRKHRSSNNYVEHEYFHLRIKLLKKKIIVYSFNKTKEIWLRILGK